jgi:hypothetical protein
LLDFLLGAADVLNTALTLVAFTGLLSIRVQWRCGLCGKQNVTGVLRFFFAMCNHFGDGQE